MDEQSAEIPQKSPEEELEERTLRVVCPNKMLPAMQQVARRLKGSFEILAKEGEEYTVPESIEPLKVRKDDTYIQIILLRPDAFDFFWRMVDRIHTSQGIKV